MFLTVLNIETLESVPFEIERNKGGTIRILSTRGIDTDENCIVTLTDKFYEFSVDFKNWYSKTGVAG